MPLGNLPPHVLVSLLAGEREIHQLLPRVVHLGGDPGLALVASPVVAGVRADDHLVGVLGHVVDEPAKPLGDPPRGVHRRQLGHLDAVRVNVAGDKVAAEPHEHAANVGLVAFVGEAVEKPLLQFGDPQLAYVKRVVVLAVHRLGQHPLLTMNVGEHEDRRGVVPHTLPRLAAFVRRYALHALQRSHRIGAASLAVDVREGELVPASQRGEFRPQPR